MNYLGHAFLSFGDGEILTGNMAGDHFKGLKVLETLPPRIAEGALLHRKIDGFADSHPAIARAKVWFREDFGLYSGAVLDTLFDHFLANDARYFSSEKALLTFTEETYQKLEEQRAYFPIGFASYFQHMKEHNWLYGYRNMMGVQRSLKGLQRRAKYIAPTEKAYETFVKHYYELNQCYYELIDDIVKYVKVELRA